MSTLWQTWSYCGLYYHRFVINFQGLDNLSTNSTKPSFTAQNQYILAMMASPTPSLNDSWLLDIGVNHHFSHKNENISNSQPFQGKDTITIG